MDKTSHAEECQIIYGDAPPSRRQSITPHSLTLGCTWWCLSKEDTAWRRGKKSHFAVAKTDKPSLSRAIKVNINSDHSCWMRMALDHCGLPPQKPFPLSNHEKKTADESQLRDSLQSTWPPILMLSRSSKTRKVWDTVRAKRSLRRQDMERDVGSWIGSGT